MNKQLPSINVRPRTIEEVINQTKYMQIQINTHTHYEDIMDAIENIYVPFLLLDTILPQDTKNPRQYESVVSRCFDRLVEAIGTLEEYTA